MLGVTKLAQHAVHGRGGVFPGHEWQGVSLACVGENSFAGGRVHTALFFPVAFSAAA